MRWLLAALALLVGSPVLADELRPVSIQFEQVDESLWVLTWKQPVAGPADSRLTIPSLPAACALDGEPRRDSAALALLGSAKVRCKGDVAGSTIGWPTLAGQGDAILRVAPLGRPVQVHRLTVDHPDATIAVRPGAAQVWRSYFAIGVGHILGGWDHLLFVIALVLLVARPWPVIKAATAFTVAHSMILVATTLGVTGLPQRPVEALIALSIVFLAVELAKGRDTFTRRLPWIVAFAFGLLHGFGFAGALREIGLPEGEVPAALVSFNLGVEAGQLLVIAAVLAIRAAIARIAPKAEAPALKLATYAIGITGAFWLIERIAA
ncbi:HupE/UreJ family protein [Qipengyuania sp. 6B39]|uniref:HupE/UreJ family protein n=1 Tax=Qipengyuania proteolytica TaxID=2867239 RepID=UPI001C897221|nr:HupE/UreJ family protein [Qipengyuania proteolytica]MBX7497178.1 HupE/UreJ family protein [Qipengyuania proteolytica]